jgi:hypothetical protein
MGASPVDQASLLMTYIYEYCRGTHYFIEDLDLYYFLQNTKLKDIDAIKHCLNNNVEWDYFVRFTDGNHLRSYPGYVHAKIPTPALSFLFLKDNHDKAFTLSTKVGYISPAIGDDVTAWAGEFNLKSVYDNTYASDDAIKSTQLVCNLMFYMAAYPECVHEGAPSSEINEYKGCRIRNITNSGIAKPRGAISAHFRAGHFRLLKNEKYVNKKGMIVFVRPTFVKGQAITVTSEGLEENQTIGATR